MCSFDFMRVQYLSTTEYGRGNPRHPCGPPAVVRVVHALLLPAAHNGGPAGAIDCFGRPGVCRGTACAIILGALRTRECCSARSSSATATGAYGGASAAANGADRTARAIHVAASAIRHHRRLRLRLWHFQSWHGGRGRTAGVLSECRRPRAPATVIRGASAGRCRPT